MCERTGTKLVIVTKDDLALERMVERAGAYLPLRKWKYIAQADIVTLALQANEYWLAASTPEEFAGIKNG